MKYDIIRVTIFEPSVSIRGKFRQDESEVGRSTVSHLLSVVWVNSGDHFCWVLCFRNISLRECNSSSTKDWMSEFMMERYWRQGRMRQKKDNGTRTTVGQIVGNTRVPVSVVWRFGVRSRRECDFFYPALSHWVCLTLPFHTKHTYRHIWSSCHVKTP